MNSAEQRIAVAQSNSAAPISMQRELNKADPKVRVDPPLRDFARSHSVNWSSPSPVIPENIALKSLKDAWEKNSNDIPQYDGYDSRKQLLYIDLAEFEIYRSPDIGHTARKSELIGLHQLEVPAPKKLCFDGYVRVGNVKHCVQGLNIRDCSIEGYGNVQHPGVVIYLQSEFASRDANYDIWYKLGEPTAEYRRFHEPFLWIAQLGKHVIDFMESQPAQSVALENFRQDFVRWLLGRFTNNMSFKSWHLEFQRQSDFRVAVHAYLDYIYHQVFNLSNSQHLFSHPVWSECMVKGMVSVQPQSQILQHTIATPIVHEAFQNMYFGQNIRRCSPSRDVEQKQERRKRELGFTTTPKKTPLLAMTNPILQSYGGSRVNIGDVVAIKADEMDRRKWRNSSDEWLAYVHDTKLRDGDVQELFVLWLYRPCDTNMFKAKYPFKNELFFSDNCNCGEGKLLSTDVVGRYDVLWEPKSIPVSQFFVRQTYVTRDSAFVSFHKEHETCVCSKPKVALSEKYRRGDTVYMTRIVQGQKILDPTIIWATNDSSKSVTVRKLLRLGRDCDDCAIEAGRTNIASNELVLTDEYVTINASRLQRKCFIQFIPKEQIYSVPSPYDRGGAGDRWFVSMSMTTHQNPKLRFLSQRPNCFHEASGVAPFQKLRGLSIFSGGGSLDRGIEEGGAVEFHTAVDFSPHAVHTQKANAHNPRIRLYCGSVDDFFKAALEGTKPDLVARVGKVEFIAAGSPCPGFSSLQQNFLSEASLRNASHISTFCSFVDLYRPQYGVLENVVSMTSTRVGFEDENVLSSIVACLVSMGYQVNQYIMDAWNYGSAQKRSRILVSIAAPGLTPISQPWHTHSIEYEGIASKSLGKLPNGERLGEREAYPTPFTALSAGEITADLPDIGNGNVQTCIPFPDHCVFPLPTFMDRCLIRHIPKSPPGCGYGVAMKLGLIPKTLEQKKSETGRSYMRIKKAGLIPCLTTRLRITDARNGASLHWAQDRPITIMEARRAQNYPDHEPIIGNLAQQFQIVGNGVDRMVSFAFGLSLRHALQTNSASSATLITNKIVQQPEYEAQIINEPDEDGYLTDATQSIIDLSITQDHAQRKRTMSPLVVIPARHKADRSSAKSILATGTANSSRANDSGKLRHGKNQPSFNEHDDVDL
ncbi:hypothetical protein J1614_010580 [Plenodomus biglobosus]|nr:hypothetical protein J1614_010580 [Plenodomus biglobosus]